MDRKEKKHRKKEKREHKNRSRSRSRSRTPKKEQKKLSPSKEEIKPIKLVDNDLIDSLKEGPSYLAQKYNEIKKEEEEKKKNVK